MTGFEIVKQLKAEQKGHHKFIKWWRIENDFVDYQLIEDFIDGVEQGQEIAGYELLDVEQMWADLQRLVPQRVTREERDGQQLVTWARPGKDDQVCPFIAKSLMTIFDCETRGNVVG